MGRSPVQYSKNPQEYRRSQVPPTSMGELHHNSNGWSTGAMQRSQSGRDDTGNSSRRCSRQKIARSFRSTRGRVVGQHARGFLMGLTKTKRKEGDSSGPYRMKILDSIISTHKNDMISFISRPTFANVMREKRGVVGDVARAVGGSLWWHHR